MNLANPAMKRMLDRVALITRAAGGLGRAAAVHLASEGAHFCLLEQTVRQYNAAWPGTDDR